MKMGKNMLVKIILLNSLKSNNFLGKMKKESWWHKQKIWSSSEEIKKAIKINKKMKKDK